MQVIAVRPLADRPGPRSLTMLARLQRGDWTYHVHHIYRGGLWDDGSGWDFGIDAYAPWSASGAGPSGHGWAYLYSFVDGTYGVSRVIHVNEALEALGYEVDRRGDARD